MKFFYMGLFFAGCLFLPGCTSHTIESKNEVTLQPVEIKPIHITIDVNIKVDRALDNFFGDLDKAQ
jgi:hypothetical protein